MKNNKIILWDWNGTLLNDINACISSMNNLLKKRNINTISYSKYRDIFTFPVEEYYKTLGFDFTEEPFKELAIEYITLYEKNSTRSVLQAGAIQVLDYFKSHDFKQVIISAMEQRSLEKQVKDNDVYHYFEEIIGLDNIHARSKIENAKRFIDSSLDKTEKQYIYIGDTFHDYEVADALNCKCILVKNGHQNLNRFELNENVKLVHDLFEIRESKEV
jgi:phosphoglycolate phosphatase